MEVSLKGVFVGNLSIRNKVSVEMSWFIVKVISYEFKMVYKRRSLY